MSQLDSEGLGRVNLGESKVEELFQKVV